MPSDRIGQQITFAVQIDAAHKYTNFIWVHARPGDTIKKICARRGHPEMAEEVADLNHIRSITKVLRPRTVTRDVGGTVTHLTPLQRDRFGVIRSDWPIKLPGTLNRGDVLNVHADDPAPTVTDGYAMFDIVKRPGRKGVSRFLGYDPIALDVPVQFEGYVNPAGAGGQIEDKIALLEEMAGRGKHSAAGTGPPPVIAVTVTDNVGNQVWLVPPNYQRTAHNPTAPLWRISNIAWDKTPLRDLKGRRLRQKATVTITEYTPISLVVRSASARAKSKKTEHRKVREALIEQSSVVEEALF